MRWVDLVECQAVGDDDVGDPLNSLAGAISRTSRQSFRANTPISSGV
jgi:hypothetical protein